MSKATVDRAALKRALGVLVKCTHRKASVPHLQHIKLEVNGDVRLTATDLEVSAVVKLPRQNRGGEFQALLPAGRLAEYVRKSKADTVTFERQDEFKTGLDGLASLVGLSTGDFPATLGEEGTLLASFKAGELAAALRVTNFAVSTEVVRYALTGVLIEVKRTGTGKGPKSWGAALVASDGKRLSATRLPVGDAHALRTIIPWKAAELLEQLTAGAGPEERVELRGTLVQATDAKTGEKSDTPQIVQLHFTVGGAGLFTRIVDGHFPDYAAVIPANIDKVYEVDRVTLVRELERVRQACTDKTLATRFAFADGKLTLFSKTVDVGEATAELPVKGNAPVTIVFNPEYVLDFCKAQGKKVERITLRLCDKERAGVLSGQEGNQYILMPLTINL
jgi:DNA polymerase III subunit beta